MWLGIVSMVLLAVLMTAAMVPDRFRLHRDYASFRYWHRALTVAVVLSAAYHVAVSGFYLDAWYQALTFGLVSVGACLGREYWARLGQIDIAAPAVYLGLSVLSAAVFAGLRNLPA